jgi:hypothetical protein
MEDWLEPRRFPVKSASANEDDGQDATTKATDTPAPPAAASGVHNATTRVTIAWPFSQIKLQEASAELIELAGLLRDVVEALSDVIPEERLRPLRDRTEAVQARLR